MNPFTVTHKINPGFSNSLFLALAFFLLVAISIVTYLPINLLIKLTGCLVIIVWFVVTIREHCWHLDQAIQSAILREDGSWIISLRDNETINADLLPGCLVQPWLTVLHFRMPNRQRKSLILLVDNIDSDTFRRLRVRLKSSN